MIKRVLATLAILVCFCSAAFANREISVQLNTRDKKIHVARVEDLAYVTFEYVRTEGHNARVRVVVENISHASPLALLVFRRDVDETAMKQIWPKIGFEKTYPGEKGRRRIYGTQEGYKNLNIITPNEVDSLFIVDVALTSPRRLKLPLYLAKYKPKDLTRKGEESTKFKILEEIILDADIEVEGWTEEDPTYVVMKNRVEQFKASLRGVTFCSNPRHLQPLEEQQRPYNAKKQQLVYEINNVFQCNTDWMSTDAPHIAYTRLLNEVYKVDLDDYRVEKCDKDKPIPPIEHTCRYCPLSAKELYYKLDDTYQRLHAGRIARSEAVSTANAIMNCYRANGRRQKSSFYGGKISEFYKRIINY